MHTRENDVYHPENSDIKSLSVPIQFSIFPFAHSLYSDHLFFHQRQAMEIISYEIENNLITLDSPAYLFSGFQKMSNFIPQIKRYQEIISRGHLVYVFAVPDIKPPDFPGLNFVLLSESHFLTREWFVIANSNEYFSALVAEQLTNNLISNPSDQVADDTLFQGIWTFDEAIVADITYQIKYGLGIEHKTINRHDYKNQLSRITVTANHLVTELENRNQQLEKNQEMYEDLVNMLVHDLRGSLTSVIGSLELLSNQKLNLEDSQELIDNSLENSRRLNGMISNVLDINKIESGKLRIHRELINLSDIINRSLTRWEITAKWSKKRILYKQIPELPLIVSDQDIIERIVDNLLSNAIKYGNKIIFAIKIIDHNIHISIQDDGPGIPPQEREKIFDKFTQAQSSIIQRKGTGLGLTFSKMAAQAIGGDITIGETELGGANFTLVLPQLSPNFNNHPGKESRRES